MSWLHADLDDGQLRLDASGGLAQAEDARARYASATPFPHIVLDDFLSEELASLLCKAFPPRELASVERRNRQQNLKFGYRPATLGRHPSAWLLEAFNTAPMLELAQAVTGHAALVPDPDFIGGGYHEIARGGHLSIHADFNFHPGLNLVRRINLIVFLTPDWEEDWGGALELWDRDMTACVRSVAPRFNRAVIFDTDKTSFHGHPEPLDCPAGRTRRSIALYYYGQRQEGEAADRITNWKLRPDEQPDKA